LSESPAEHGSQMAKPFVSALIDTYNHERFIEKAVVSVLEQDFPAEEREILVVDDGSSDRTREIVKKFEPRVRLLRKTNGGQGSAFNAGIPECRGEIVAFLDGDDWWAAGKLRAVTRALEEDSTIGFVGHGITEVYSDGRERTELLRENPRVRISSIDGARAFRLRKSFLGTSRMTMRRSVLREIGAVPEVLRIQADEYLFTMAAAIADVVILHEPLTFYRLHESNAFQVPDGNRESLRTKQKVLDALAESLEKSLREHGIAEEVIRIVVDWIQTEADLIRLGMENGMPWETVRAELASYGIAHEGAPLTHWLFKFCALLPACVLPSQTYYALRQRFSKSDAYRRARQKWLPFLEPAHVDRYRSTRP
jgi:glycosyltransferase involved in cell wall biosynthesis